MFAMKSMLAKLMTEMSLLERLKLRAGIFSGAHQRRSPFCLRKRKLQKCVINLLTNCMLWGSLGWDRCSLKGKHITVTFEQWGIKLFLFSYILLHRWVKKIFLSLIHEFWNIFFDYKRSHSLITDNVDISDKTPVILLSKHNHFLIIFMYFLWL